jgi:hypothetical protein
MVALWAKPGDLVQNKPPELKSFSLSRPPAAVMDDIVGWAKRSDYRIATVIADRNVLILSDRPSVLSFGFFYPIYLSPMGGNGTLVEVGIKSRLLQDNFGNPIRHSKHDACVADLRSAVS